MADPVKPIHPAVSHFKEPYRDFAKLLRTWLVAYGIGFPVLLASQDTMTHAVSESGFGRQIVLCFLGGVSFQILGALMYKSTMWYLYVGEIDPATQTSRRYRSADCISMQYWLEMLIDIATLALFIVGTWRILDVVLH